MTQKQCIICGNSQNIPLLSGVEALGKSWMILQCTNCGIARTAPLPDSKTLHNKYADAYWAIADDRVVSGAYNIRMKGFARQLSRLSCPNASVLDIGAGNGSWVRLLKEERLNAIGIDPYAKKNIDENVLPYSIEEIPFSPNSYDMITFMHVLEHLPDPLHSLQIANDLLKPNGLLVIEVPNIESMGFYLFGKRWFQLDIPAHINHFCEKSLLYLIRQIGSYEVIVKDGFSLRDAPSSLVNTIFPLFRPQTVRIRHKGHYPSLLKIAYLIFQLSFLPVAWISAKTGYGEIIRLVLRKNLK